MTHRPARPWPRVLIVFLAACAPIHAPPGAPAPPFDALAGSAPPLDTPAESPAPMGISPADTPAADADVSWLRRTGLLVPVRGVSVTAIEDSFDAPRDGGRRHDAVDIPAPRGTPVVAAVEGSVLRVGTNPAGGNVVWLSDVERRFAYYYAHLDRFGKGLSAGTHVLRGAIVGFVGTTGNAPAGLPHLHFQVMRTTDVAKWWTGTPVNPVPFLTESLPVTPAGARR